MALTVCIYAKTFYYPEGGGHAWVYLNWALGLKSLGCRVIWLESVYPSDSTQDLYSNLTALRTRLNRYGLQDITLCTCSGECIPQSPAGCVDLDEAAESDLFLNLAYAEFPSLMNRFRRRAFVDIDPGLTQIWVSQGKMEIPRHDVYFTIGETVGQPGACFPDLNLNWNYSPPCVTLDYWVPSPAPGAVPFTTISHWSGDEWMQGDGEIYCNDKRAGFLPFLDLPRHTSKPIELALCLGANENEERESLINRGWRIANPAEVAATPWDYQRYVQNSFGEFCCAKPSCVRLQNAWISDRTICYLASAKPAIVQHTGPSRFLPDAAGLFRFHDVESAARSIEHVISNYKDECRLARQLAEEYFDARKVVSSVLERAL